MGSISNVRLGVCEVTYNSVILGHTNGGCEVTVKNEISEVNVDAYGITPMKAFHKGTQVEVKATFSEYQYDILKEVINGSLKIEGTGGTPVDALGVGALAGTALAGAALVLHPTIAGVATGLDVTVFLAVVTGETKLPFKVDEETKYEVTWFGLVSESDADGDGNGFMAKFGTTYPA